MQALGSTTAYPLAIQRGPRARSYPDNTYTRDRDGNPIRPYDMSTDNIAEYMGVRVDPVDVAVQTDLEKVEAPIDPDGTAAAKGRAGWVLDGRLNDSFKAVNLLWNGDVAGRRVDRPSEGLRPGDFLVPPDAPDDLVAEVARESRKRRWSRWGTARARSSSSASGRSTGCRRTARSSWSSTRW